MTTKPSKKQCEITGVSKALIRKAVKHWEKERTKSKPRMGATALLSSGSYVASLPPPPLPGSQEYYRCINDWYRCYMQASYLDGYRNQMAQLQQQITNGEIMLTGYLEGYAQCIGGFPV